MLDCLPHFFGLDLIASHFDEPWQVVEDAFRNVLYTTKKTAWTTLIPYICKTLSDEFRWAAISIMTHDYKITKRRRISR